MNNIDKKQFTLLCIAPILCTSMLLLMPFLTNKLGRTIGYIAGFCIYWFVFCLPISLYYCNGFSGLKEIYSQKSDIKITMRNIYYLLAFIPCIATYFVVFKEFAPIAGFKVLAIVLLYALINGTLEEMFWRGIFNKVFDNIFLAYIYPTIFFGVWHIALYFLKGIIYQGGFASLVGGSFFMGLLWGLVAYKTKSIKVVTIAHIITNFFAFTGFVFENWFG
ncbi:CPBP family intramembrane metalloprotease [Tissierella sp. MSJ-40]|uniref:CPBP family intramembrane metalloprotease n=1 Tax=Tissierella simiarum TaxID=2841534 RepID=A0ABS6E8B2_9FIRM|nr:CPBP family intramembrane glutamic endopeptidase [Tissierella simiarum]MBU5439154.1 CPBP family intramembrane metalloprotease [Tissierella simiarum]